MSVSGERGVIASAVTSIIPCTANMPSMINPPCAFVIPRVGDWLVNLQRSSAHNRFELYVLLARPGVIEEYQATLDSYLTTTGATSIKAAIEGASYTGQCNFAKVTGWRNYGSVTINETVYIGIIFDIETY